MSYTSTLGRKERKLYVVFTLRRPPLCGWIYINGLKSCAWEKRDFKWQPGHCSYKNTNVRGLGFKLRRFFILSIFFSFYHQARGPKKHLKRVAAPKHWMLDKLTGVFAPRPSTGPHKLRECLPLIIFLRNRLKYALTGDEVKKICMQRFIKIDGKVRTDITYPAGFMDVISIEKTGEHFRLIYDIKGRFTVHRITPEEAKYKLCKVRKIFVGTKGIPHLVTHDARTIRYPDPLIKVNDTVQIDLETGKITQFIKFDTGNLCMVIGGANLGRIGVITNRERHPGSFDVVHVKDSAGNTFATRLSNIFVIGKGNKGWVSLPRGKGIRLTIAEERDKRLAAKQSTS
ncbi:40S ribosomal protein S4, X isoform [Polypterus senegalus]|uniref:40S ribosomal protein S4, X isoform n=1 Tax=Polypterus senegalus TaxID=55291 RepID=UPI00196554A7|nr:40S ribosomal protein S4, X isoform [Polypterus senegalus]